MKHRIVIFGTSPFGIPAFSALRTADEIEIVGVVTQPARPVGRHHQLQPSAVHTWATEHHLNTFTPEGLKNSEIVGLLQELRADTYVVASYGLLVPKMILDIPTNGAVNIHASLLPRWRGASPIAAAIAAGDQVTGNTLMLMDEGLDTGPIIQMNSIAINPQETRPELEVRLSTLAGETILTNLLKWWGGELKPQSQPEEGILLAPRLTRDDGRASWKDANALARLIRAYEPWPGVWTTWKGRELKILKADVRKDQPTAEPGMVVTVSSGWGIVCQDGTLVPRQVQFSGRQPVDSALVPGGYPGFIGSILD